MEFRTLGRTGLDVSVISLGTEYLINRPRAHVATVIHEAIAQGINYFDLFFAQPEFRDNMGAALQGLRERVILAAHLGAAEQNGQYQRTRDLKISEQLILDFLRRYATDYVDVLFLHNSDGQEDYDLLMQPGGFFDLALRFQREGKARFIGFSGHTVSTARQAVDSGKIDVLMFPLNLAANAVPGRKDLLKACIAQNVGFVAMKPYAGGKLLNTERTIRMEIYHRGGDNLELEKSAPITPVQCLSYVISQMGVSNVVPGCADLEQLAAALAYWKATAEEKDFSGIMADFEQYEAGECVYCNHCLPCPSVIDIGLTIHLFERAQHHKTADVQAAYAAMSAKASDCIECGVCVERCPFGVDVIAKMRQAATLLG